MKKPYLFHFAMQAAHILVLMVACYSLPAQMWDLNQKPGSSGQQPADNLGISVSVSDSFMIAGAWWEELEGILLPDTTASGAAYIYKLQPNGIWTEIQKLVLKRSGSLPQAFTRGRL